MGFCADYAYSKVSKGANVSKREYNREVGQKNSEETKVIERQKGFPRLQKGLIPVMEAGAKLHRAPKTSKVRKGANTDIPMMYGSVINTDYFFESDRPSPYTDFGVYQIPTNDAMTFIPVKTGPWARGGAVFHNGIYYMHCYDEDDYSDECVGYDLETGKEKYWTDVNVYTVGMDVWENQVYGIVWKKGSGGGTYSLCKINHKPEDDDNDAKVTTNTIAELRGHFSGFAIDGEGQAYTLKSSYDEGDYSEAYLYKIDLQTGALSKVGEELGYDYYVKQTSMAFERQSGRLFLTMETWDRSGLYEVDTDSGEADLLYEFPHFERVVGLYIPPLPEPGTPAEATNLTCSFPNGGFQGTFSFTVPTVTYGGDPASGQVSYKVLLGSQNIKEGTAQVGETVTVDATVNASGYYEFSVILSNSLGSGPVATYKTYIGSGVPNTPEVSLTRNGDNMAISWNTVNSTVEGGFIDASAVKYTVKRYPGGDVVAQNLTATNYTDNLPTPDDGIFNYYYTVTAHNNDVYSAEGKSNEITVGNGYKVPYSYDFNDPYQFQYYTVVDANNDSYTWSLIQNELFLRTIIGGHGDDWVITPGIYLEKDKMYSFEFDVKCISASTPTRLEVCWGQGTTPEAMTNVALEPFNTYTDDVTFKRIKARIIPSESGYYNMGVHGINEVMSSLNYSHLDNFQVVEGIDVPAAPNNFTVEPGKDAALEATVSFLVPDKFFSGNNITSNEKIIIYQDGLEVATLPSEAPKTAVSKTFTVDQDGEYTFSARAYVVVNGTELEGDLISSTVYIGIDYPETPAHFTMSEPETPGLVHMEWDAVTKDVRGATLPNVLYNVYKIEGNSTVPRGYQLTSPSHDYRLVKEGSQEFVQMAVAAVSIRGEGQKAIINGFVGDPYEGYAESFVNGLTRHDIAINYENYYEERPFWAICTNSTIDGLVSSDRDNGFIAMQASYSKEAASLMLGKISLKGMNHPVVSYYTYNIEGSGANPLDENVIKVFAREFGSTEDYKEISSIKVCDTGEKESWNKVVADLNGYKDKVVEVKIGITVENMSLTTLDNIKVADKVAKDLAVILEAPEYVMPDSEVELVATVRNEADENAGAYTVKFKKDGNVIFKSIDFDGLVCGGSTMAKVSYPVSAIAEEPLLFTAEVVFAGDENTDNNVSDEVVVTPSVSLYPEPFNLEGEILDEGVNISWTAPDLTTIRSLNVSETFESGKFGDTTFGDWTFVDVDGKPIGTGYGMSGAPIVVPGVTEGKTKASFIVHDSSLSNLGDLSSSHSGSKSLASFYTYEEVDKDDWAISPLLSGDAQTVSFFARSYVDYYPERMEVWYSTSSVNPDDFVRIEDATVAVVPAEWTRYDIALPQGAKHFAIRNNTIGDNQFIFFIDDASFVAGLDFSGLTLKGYNVYRNGMRLNDAPIVECKYLDTDLLPQNNIYTVTAVYDEGESKGSESVSLVPSSIGDMTGDILVSTLPGRIIITGATDDLISIFSLDGSTIATGLTGDFIEVEVSFGVYVVQIGHKTYKVVVK